MQLLQLGPEVMTLIVYPLVFIGIVYIAYKVFQGFKEYDENKRDG